MFSQCLHCVRVCVWLKWFVSWFCLFVFQCFRDFLFRDYFCRKLLLWLLFSCSLFSYFFGCLCLFVLFCGFVSFFRRVLTLAERHPHTHTRAKAKTSTTSPQKCTQDIHTDRTQTQPHTMTIWWIAPKTRETFSHPTHKHIGEHGRSVLDTMTKWYVSTQTCATNPSNVEMQKKWTTHTQDAQLKGKWMCFMVTIITFFLKKKKDHNCNWDYLNRHPQELRFKMSDMLGACQIFKCLTLFSTTLRF